MVKMPRAGSRWNPPSVPCVARLVKLPEHTPEHLHCRVARRRDTALREQRGNLRLHRLNDPRPDILWRRREGDVIDHHHDVVEVELGSSDRCSNTDPQRLPMHP